jgi:two-component system response regulator MprA
MSTGKVLVVDDEDNIVNLIRDSLEDEGLTVISADNGFAALAAVDRERPDLVIADVMMPRLSGLDLVKALRNRPDTYTLPVLLLSARDSAEAVAEGLASGAVDYITKPFKVAELVGKVRHHISRGRAL